MPGRLTDRNKLLNCS